MIFYKANDGSENYKMFSDMYAVFEKICHQLDSVEMVYLCSCLIDI